MMNEENVKNLVDTCIKISLDIIRNKNDIYQESDWKCFLYYLIKKELEAKYKEEMVLHTEIRLKGYEERQKCDLALLNINSNNIDYNKKKKNEAVTPIIAIELKMHGGKSRKWDNTSFMEKVEEFKKDYERLLKCGAYSTYCLFVDWEIIDKEFIKEREDLFKEKFPSNDLIKSDYSHVEK